MSDTEFDDMVDGSSRKEDTFLALDIGGTSVTCGLVSRSGEILMTDSFPTAQGPSPAAMTEIMADKLKDIWTKADRHRRPKALGIGAPGWIKPTEGIVVMAPNIPGWREVPITRIMSEAMDLPAILENDANLYALGEWLAGAGKGHDNEITLTLGTGVGGGLILNGHLWSGSFTSAAEVGHIPLNPWSGAICGCGRKGCLETVTSAKGMTRLGLEWLASGRETLYKGPPEELNPAVMQKLALKKDPMSLSVFKEAGEALGLALAAIFNLLSLEVAVIGGGAAGAFDFIINHLLATLGEHLVTAQINEIQVVKGLLGVNAPLVGAAALLEAAGY
ncbi:MAG: ROK family protein [Deltaproteobacteria bacterium]|jgi:glucokinase|nr:ROK family protein [Deltaproteobacteria bacterium]